MANNYSDMDAARARQQYRDTVRDSGHTQSLPPTGGGLASAYSIMGSGAEFGGANPSAYAGALQRMQSTYGNRAIQRYMGNWQSGAGYAGGEGTSTASLGGMHAQASTAVRMEPVPDGAEVGGWGRPADGNGFFGFYESAPYDFEAGFGLDLGGTTFLGGSASGGTWETEGGGTRSGGKFNVGLLPDAKVGGFEGGTLAVGGEASFGNDGFTLGGGVTIGAVGGTVGDNFSEESNTDESMRVGVSEGPSAGLRGHWGDTDNDGYREYGFGFDAGFLSYDVKSEDPLRSMMTSAPPFNILPDMINPTSYLPDGNLTEGALNMAASADDWLYDTIDSGLEWASPWWMGESGGLEPTDGQQAQAQSEGGSGSLFSWF